MDSLIFALNAVAPIVAMVAIGYILKRIGFMSAEFAKMANKLVFRLFLPCMLFLNVYNIGNLGEMDFGYVGYVVAAVLVIFAVTLPLTRLAAKGNAHYMVSKEIDPVTSAAVSKIERLSDEQRVLEVARMLSGSVLTDEAVANAKSLLKA